MQDRCDAIKQNESELEKHKNSVFIFIVCFNIRGYIILKTPSKVNIQFQKYSHFSDAQNNQMQNVLLFLALSKNNY